MTGPKPASLLDRLLSWRRVDSITGCWLPVTYPANEYVRITYKGRKELIHRLSAIEFLGLDLTVGHLQVNHKSVCPNKACFNPDHIYIGTAKENSIDYSNSKTHCINGHKLDSFNTYAKVIRNGPRKGSFIKNCRECGKINARKRRRG